MRHTSDPETLILSHGGSLRELIVDARRAAQLQAESRNWRSWDLTPRQLCDLELLLNGGFSPLAGFVTRRDYEPVRDRMRLADDTLWPIPVALDVPETLGGALAPGERLALRDAEGVMLAVLHEEDVWQPDREREPFEAQELVHAHEQELGIQMVPFRTVVYVEGRDEYLPDDDLPPGAQTLDLSGTELRRLLNEGRDLPGWFTFPAVARELQRTHPPRARQGFTLLFTGLSGSGKSTIANVLLVKFLERGGRQVTLLDGDLVRRHLSSELGFSKEHRDINIRRIGYVASEITKNGGIAICAPIAPYDSVRKEVRRMVEPLGGFVLVHLATPIEVCEARDRKGLYAKARAGLVQQFTGVSDPYEPPADAEIVIDTTDLSPEQAADAILHHLIQDGYIATDGQG